MRTLLAAALLLSTAPAMAQTRPPLVTQEFETIYSDTQRDRDEAISRRFVQGLLAPSVSFEDQYAKWKNPVCPNVYGMSASSKYVLERRIRSVAQEIGAPINRNDPCTPNITVIVTPDPQASLDSIAAHAPYLVIGGKKRQLTVTQPIQSWYTTYRRDFNGLAALDLTWEDAETAGGGPTGGTGNEAPRVTAQGNRLSTGVSPEMAGVVVLVDIKAITGMTLGTLGDYLALLALAPAPVTGRCQEAPSIANLMAKGCATDVKSTQLTGVDIAMLTGLYQTPEKPEMIQKQRIVGAMRRTLETQFGR
jgi:hypothetical protein